MTSVIFKGNLEIETDEILVSFSFFLFFFYINPEACVNWLEWNYSQIRTLRRGERISAGSSCHHCRLTIGEVVGQKIVFHCCIKTEYSWYKPPKVYLRLFYCSYYIRFPKAKCWYNSFRSSHLFRNSLPVHSASAIARMVEVVIYCNIGGFFPSKYKEGTKITVEKTTYHDMINVVLSNILCCAGIYLFFQ